MKQLYIKIVLIVVGAMMSQNLIGQVKSQQLPNFTNPFQTNKTSSVDSVLTPKPAKSDQLKSKKIETLEGSFFVNLSKHKLKFRDLENELNDLLDLSDDHSFKEISYHKQKSHGVKQKADQKEPDQKHYQHYYKGFKVDESNIIAHGENGFVKTLNGRIVKFSDLEIEQTISKEQALQTAKEYLDVTELIKTYPIEKVIARIPSEESPKIRAVQKIRIDSYDPFEMCYVLVDAMR